MAYSGAGVKWKSFLGSLRGLFCRKSLYPWYALLFFVAYFSAISMTLEKTFSLDDHFFHIRFAELLREKGFSALSDFDSIYFSRIGIGHEYLLYYNFLFYAVLIPFSLISPLVVGIKLYGVFALTFSFMTTYLFLRSLKIGKPFLWNLLFLIGLMSSGWIARLAFARPFSLAPALLVIMLYGIFRKKGWLLVLISFAYFYWHTATFLFPLCLAFGYFLFEIFYGRKPDWKPVICSLIGTAIGAFSAYLISPGVVKSIGEVTFPVFFDTAMSKSTGITEGGEVYGRSLISVSNSFVWFFSGLCIAGAYEIARYVREKRNALSEPESANSEMQPLRASLFAASLVFFAASSLSARFLDYFVFFCFLYAAIALSDMARFVSVDKRVIGRPLKVGLSVVFLYLLASLSLNTYDSLASAGSYLTGQPSAEWMNDHLSKGKIIFDVDWDSFPVLYYYTGDRFRYVTGLEPRLLYDLDSRLYWEWYNIGNGIYCDRSDCQEETSDRDAYLANKSLKDAWLRKEGRLIADAILSDFKTDAIVVPSNRKELIEIMDSSGCFEKRFGDVQNDAYLVYSAIPSDVDIRDKN